MTDEHRLVAGGDTVDAWALTDTVTRLRRVLRASIRQQYPWEQLPMAQVELMQRLADEPGLRLRELARRHRLATNTVSTLVQQLVIAGLVSREPDPGDRRAVVLGLTPDGAHRLQEWLAAHEERLRTALTQLSARDRQRIQAALPALQGLVGALEAEQEATVEGDERAGAAPKPSRRLRPTVGSPEPPLR